jgi:protein TonB
MSATLVTTVPLPASQVQTQNVLANDSKGLTKSLPQVQEETPDAIPIPDKEAKKKNRPETSTTKQKAAVPEEPSNAIPYGQGGPVSGPYGTFSAGGAKGGFGFSGGGGDFGSRYSWYVKVVQQKVSENWLKYEIDPRISDAQRVYLTFDITRGGRTSRWSSRAAFRRSTNRQFVRFNVSTRLVPCPLTTVVAKSRLSSGLISNGRSKTCR